ncbi:MAG: DNA gyrase modulator, partial [Candidatus Fermentibacteria bacterium]|nr:DNA gyrase modulator [Candidatus Fermentibacteria bacterium]
MSIFNDLKEAITGNIGRMMDAGAQYSDARWYEDDSSEMLMLLDGNLEGNDTSVESGLGVRVLYGGAWGFAATSQTADVDSCFDRAKANAVSASMLVKVKLDMGKQSGHIGSYTSPFKVDPIDVSLADKVDFLKGVDDSLTEDWILR